MIFFFLLARKRRESAFAASGCCATVEVPAHGFVVGSSGIMRPGGPVRTWIRKFASACAMASAIAAGLMVYMHFTRKWKQAGFPVIPISALAQIEQASTPQQPQQASGAIPLAQGTGGVYRGGQQAEKQRTSFLDNLDFEG